MTRGRRKDLPGSASDCIDYSPIPPGWEYWEEAFRRKFDPKFRDKLCIERSFFKMEQNAYNAEDRIDRKTLERTLARATKAGSFDDQSIQDFVFASISDFRNRSPVPTFEEQIDYFLSELANNPEDFFMVGPKPEITYTRAFYRLFLDTGYDCTGLSKSTHVGGNVGKDLFTPPPIIEFINRIVFRQDKCSVADAWKIQKHIDDLRSELKRVD